MGIRSCDAWELSKPRDQVLQRILEQNLAALILWPVLGVVFHGATVVQLISAGECSTGHTIISLACLWCFWAMYKATLNRRTGLLRGLYLFCGLLQMAFYLNYLRGKDTISNVHLYLDMGTNLHSVTPQLVMGLTGLPIEAYVLFIGGHVTAASLLYYNIAKMSWHFAVLRALGIHTLTMSAALIVHKRARDFMRSPHTKRASCQQDKLRSQQDLLSTQVVSWPSITTKVVRRVHTFFSLRHSTLHTDSSTQEGPFPGCPCNRELQEELKDAQQQQQRQQQQQQAQARAQQEVHQGQQQQQQQQQQAQAHVQQKQHQKQELVQRQQQQAQTHDQQQQQQQQMHTHARQNVHEEQQVEKHAQKKQQQQQQQQQQSIGVAGKSISAVDQEPMDPVQHSNVRKSLANGSLGRDNSTSNLSNHCMRWPACSWSPTVQKAVFEAAHVLAERRGQKHFISKLETGSPDPKKALRSLRESCRFIVKLKGSTMPDNVPEGGLTQFQQKLQMYQCLAPAVRSGCLVISYDTAPCNPACALEEMSQAILVEAKEWAQEQGLLEPGEDALTVQACPSKYWDSTLNGQSSAYSIAVHTPFLVHKLERLTPASSTQQQPLQQQQMDFAGIQAPGCVQEQEAVCEFELTICAPQSEHELRGWQGAADAPEADKSHSLSLLATLGGQFLGVTVKKDSLGKAGERVAQVCVSLPTDFLDTSSSCPRPLMLELWASGTLVCSYSAMLVPPSLHSASALKELQGWAAGLTGTPPEGSGPFMRDLVRWMRFQAYAQQQQEQQQQGVETATYGELPDGAMQEQQQQGVETASDGDLSDGPIQEQQQQQQGKGAASDADQSDEAMQQQLELMTAVGMGLLDYSLSQSMVAVAGLILECFAAYPFCIPSLALLNTLSAACPEDHQDASPTGSLHASSQLDGTLHSCPAPAVPTPFTLNTAAPPGTTPSTLSTVAPPKTTPSTLSTVAPPGTTPSTLSTAAPRTSLSSALTRLMAAPSATSYKLAAVGKGLSALHARLFTEDDADYRAWSNAQVAPLAKSWSRVWVLGIFVGALRMALTEGVPPIREISSWAPVLLAYTAGALSLRPGSRHSEVILAAISAARSCFAFMLGTGILPFSATNKLLLGWRAEVPAEIIMMSVMERVRLTWMVPLRALLAVSLWLVYMRLGLAFPATQSVLVNLCSLGVTAAVEQRCRRLYASLRLSAKHQALADGGASHAPTWPSSDGASKGEHALKAQHF